MGPAHIGDSFWWGISFYALLMIFMKCGGVRLLTDKPRRR